MSPKPSWVDGRADVLVAAMRELGMSVSLPPSSSTNADRGVVADQHPPCRGTQIPHGDALTDLARAIAHSVVDEMPGADLFQASRTAAVPLPTLARAIAGLAEAVHVRLYERDEVDHLRTTIAQLAQELSAIGLILADSDIRQVGAIPTVMLPPGLINRAARYLEASASLIAEGVCVDNFDDHQAKGLAASFAQDAKALRFYANE